MSKKVWIIIPAYNEQRVIGSVIREVKSAGYNKIVVIDDCSKDNTAKEAQKAGAVVLKHMINLGQGAGLKTGNMYALRNSADIIVHFDADGQMQAKDIKKMVAPIVSKKVDVTLGSRFLGTAENIDFGKKIMLKLARFVVYILYGLWLTDPQNGFRALSNKAVKQIKITSDAMEHAGEILHEIKMKSLKYKEIPVHIRYTNYSRQKGQSWTKSFSLGTQMVIRKLLKR